jgi:hypothetical protein
MLRMMIKKVDEGKKIYNLSDNERKIILCRNRRRKRTNTKDNCAFTLHLEYEKIVSSETLAPSSINTLL